MTPRGRRAAALVAVGAALAACAPRDPVAVSAREVCDGVDDDANGIVDDLDANGDGLCDCLRIGVLGFPGRQGTIDAIRAWMHGRAVPTAILAGEELTPARLAGLDVVVVQDVRDGAGDGTAGQEGIGVGIGRPYLDSEVRALAAWVDAGGGLLTLAAFSSTAGENTNVNRLLSPFGLSYGTSRILESSSGSTLPVTHWDGSHPVASGISRIGVNTGYAVSGGALVAWEPAPGAYDVGRAVEWGRGRVFAWGDEWIEYDSEWSGAGGAEVRRLWGNALRWLSKAGYCQVDAPD